jgi:hypothetical protein
MPSDQTLLFGKDQRVLQHSRDSLRLATWVGIVLKSDWFQQLALGDSAQISKTSDRHCWSVVHFNGEHSLYMIICDTYDQQQDSFIIGFMCAAMSRWSLRLCEWSVIKILQQLPYGWSICSPAIVYESCICLTCVSYVRNKAEFGIMFRMVTCVLFQQHQSSSVWWGNQRCAQGQCEYRFRIKLWATMWLTISLFCIFYESNVDNSSVECEFSSIVGYCNLFIVVAYRNEFMR